MQASQISVRYLDSFTTLAMDKGRKTQAKVHYLGVVVEEMLS